MTTIQNKSSAFVLLLILLQVMLSNCSPRGCKDETADNFEPKALKECDCCQYSAKVVFWYGEGKYRQFEANGAKYLIFKANGIECGRGRSLNYFYSGQPSPPNNKVSSIDYQDGETGIIPLGQVKSRTMLLSCEDQNHTLYWSDSILVKSFEAINCEIR